MCVQVPVYLIYEDFLIVFFFIFFKVKIFEPRSPTYNPIILSTLSPNPILPKDFLIGEMVTRKRALNIKNVSAWCRSHKRNHDIYLKNVLKSVSKDSKNPNNIILYYKGLITTLPP